LVPIKSSLVFIWISFFAQVLWSQTETEINTSLRQLGAANGQIAVESVFVVDSFNMDKHYKVVYLDNSFARRPKLDDKAQYRVNQLMFQENLPMYTFFKNAPDSIHIDSLVLSKAEGSMKNTFLIYRAVMVYKEGMKTFRYQIDKGYVSQVTVLKKKMTWYTEDLSGLYKLNNRTWPVVKYFDKQGMLEEISTVVYLDIGVREIIWTAEK
jgi:hypothetical protein